MLTVSVRFLTLEDVEKFVRIVSKYPMDIDISAGNTVLDAKSFQGLCTVGLNTKLACTIHSSKEEAKNILIDISKYVLDDVNKLLV